MRRALPSLLLLTVLVGAVAPAQAQTSGSGGGSSATTATGTDGGEPDTREATRQRREEVEAELDVLRRSDVQLQADLDRLDAEIAATAERAAAADAELVGLRQELDRLRGELTEAEQRALDAHDALIDRAVAAYVDPRPEVGTALLTDGDLEAVGRRQVLLGAVADRDREVLEELLAAEDHLRSTQDETSQAEGRAAELRASVAADEERLRTARAEQELVAATLEDRIAHFQDEADALAAQEAQLTQLIAQQQAAARAATTTTTAPSTTTTTRPTTSTTVAGTVPSPTTTTTRAPTTTTTRPSGTQLSWPTPGPVTSTFGPRWGRMHQGIDIGAPTGQAISASASGTAFFVGEMSGYGNLILVDHGNGMVTAYAHQSAFAVSEGQSVSRGQTIGYVGSTGNSTGPHLHFEVRIWGTAVDPMLYLG